MRNQIHGVQEQRYIESLANVSSSYPDSLPRLEKLKLMPGSIRLQKIKWKQQDL
jgi:hypothetical protein